MSSTETVIQSDALGTLKATRQRYVLIFVLMVTITIAYADRVNVSVLAASDVFLREMGVKGHPMQIGMLMTLFLFAYGISNVCLSFLGDIFGPRKIMFAAILLWAVSMLFGGVATTFTAILASRVLLGLGEGMHHPMQSSFIKKWFPPKERGKANAAWGVGMSIAPAMSMPIFTWIIAAFGWRSSFYTCAVVSLIPLYLIWFHTTDTPRQHKRVNTAELQYIEEGLAQEAKKEQAPSGETLWASAKLVIKNYRVWLLTAYWSCYLICFWGILMWLPSYLKSARGFSWAQMGMLSSVPFIVSVCTKAFGGWASDRVGRSAPFCVGAMLAVAAGVYSAAVVHSNIASAVCLTIGFGCTGFGLPTCWSLMQGLVPAKSISLAAGGINGICNGISSASPAIIGFFISVTGSYSGGLFFVVGAALVGAASVLVLALQGY